MRQVTVKAYAFRLGITPTRVRQLLQAGRIPGAIKLGRDWLIPDDAVRTPGSTKGQKSASDPPSSPTGTLPHP